MRVLVLLIAFSLVCGSCKKKDPCEGSYTCIPDPFLFVGFYLLNEKGFDFLNKDELSQFKINNPRFSITPYKGKTFFSLENSKPSIEYVKFVPEDEDTIRFSEIVNNKYNVYFNNDLIVKDYTIGSASCDTCKITEIIKKRK